MHPGSTPGSAGTVVTIDGPAGSGKSTLARLLADRLGFRFLDSGAMYRALTLKALRGGVVTAAVSVVAAHRSVREGMVERQRAFVREGGGRGVVVEGRDIGTVVFPDAAVKFFLDATPEERARRRAAQTGGSAADEQAAMGRRDAADAGRAVAPLRAAADAETVDTTGRSIEQVLEVLLERVRGRLKGA